MNILMILNSDFGVRGTIGSRALPTAKLIPKNDLTIFCRDYNKKLKKDFNIIKVIPFGTFFMKVLTAIPIYIYNKFPSNNLKLWFFETFLLWRLKSFDLKKVDIIHSWDYCPRVFKYIKKKNPKIKIIKDLVMALPNILDPIRKKEKYWKDIPSKITKDVKKSIPYIDNYIVPSQSTFQSLVNEKIPYSKIGLILYGVDVNTIKPLHNKNYEGKFKVAFVGNVNNRKGVKYLIDAWKELKLKNAELNFYGHVYTEVKPYLKNKNKYNINTPGFIDVPKELPKNSVLVHPSLLETTPKAINEALAAGLPVIATVNSGPSFENGEQGFIIDNQDKAAIKEKLKYYYYNRDELKKASKKAREFIEPFSWDKYAENVNYFYEGILK